MHSVLETRERATITSELIRIVGAATDNVFLARDVAPAVYAESLEWDSANHGKAASLRNHYETTLGAFDHACLDGVTRKVEYVGGIEVSWIRPNTYRMTARVREAIATD